MSNPAILLVEDNEDDVFLFRRALKAAAVINPVFLAQDGQEALDYLSGVDRFADRSRFPIPTAIFLDLKLPLKSGFVVLDWIRAQANRSLGQVFVNSSESQVMIAQH